MAHTRALELNRLIADDRAYVRGGLLLSHRVRVPQGGCSFSSLGTIQSMSMTVYVALRHFGLR